MKQKTTESNLSRREIESTKRIHNRVRRLCLHLCFSTESQKQKLSDMGNQLEQAVLSNNFEAFIRISAEMKSYKAKTDTEIRLTQKVLYGTACALHKVVDRFSIKESFSFPGEFIQKPSQKRVRSSSMGKPASPIINSFLTSFCDTSATDNSTSESGTDHSATDEPAAKKQKISNTSTTNTTGIFSGPEAGALGHFAVEVIPMVTMG